MTYFPFDNVYPVPLMSTSRLQRVSDEQSLNYAVGYLQKDRVRFLLENKDKRSLNDYVLQIFNMGYVSSNYEYRDNKQAFRDIDELLVKAGYKKERVFL